MTDISLTFIIIPKQKGFSQPLRTSSSNRMWTLLTCKRRFLKNSIVLLSTDCSPVFLSSDTFGETLGLNLSWLVKMLNMLLGS